MKNKLLKDDSWKEDRNIPKDDEASTTGYDRESGDNDDRAHRRDVEKIELRIIDTSEQDITTYGRIFNEHRRRMIRSEDQVMQT